MTPEDIQRWSDEYDSVCLERHELGERKYGPGTWLGIDTLQHAMDEVADLGNYARFTWIKLRMLQELLGGDGSTAAAIPGNEMLGKPAGQEGFFNPFRKTTG